MLFHRNRTSLSLHFHTHTHNFSTGTLVAYIGPSLFNLIFCEFYFKLNLNLVTLIQNSLITLTHNYQVCINILDNKQHFFGALFLCICKKNNRVCLCREELYTTKAAPTGYVINLVVNLNKNLQLLDGCLRKHREKKVEG